VNSRLMIAGLVLVVVAGGAPAWAGMAPVSTEPTTLTTAGRTIQLEPSLFAQGLATDAVTFRITGPTRQIIDVEILDIAVGPTGARSLLPAGSTPHTLQGVMTLGPFEGHYIPDGTTQNFSVNVSSATPRNDVRYGGVRVTITPDTRLTGSPSLDTVSGVLLMVLVVPEGFDGVLPDAGETTLTLSSFRVSPLGEENIFERILPDIPGVVNRGPVTIDVDLTNESNNPFLLTTEWTLSSGDELLLTSSRGQTLVFGEQTTREQVETVFDIPGSTRLVNALPAFGVVDVHLGGEARLGQSLLTSIDQSTSFLVLRWKEPFAVVLALTTVWFLLWSTRRSAPGKSTPAPGGTRKARRVLSERG
jgi:hypothetical protein